MPSTTSALSLGEGEVLGLLGESGSGKSVTLRALMRLLPKKRTQISGSVDVLGRDVLALDDEELSAFRGQTVSMIFQEPALALDPVYTIGQQIAESVMRHEGKSHKRRNGARAGNAGSGADPPPPGAVSMPIRTRCPAACGSAP
jgi:ABC-type dipeptide/oligopeptide/nickel transport system ATPase component